VKALVSWYWPLVVSSMQFEATCVVCESPDGDVSWCGVGSYVVSVEGEGPWVSEEVAAAVLPQDETIVAVAYPDPNEVTTTDIYVRRSQG
jgi:hypothetical protein